MRKFATGAPSYGSRRLPQALPKALSEPLATAEVSDHADEDHGHDPEHGEEARLVPFARDPGVHPHHARDQGQRQDDHADCGQDPEDAVEAMGDHRLVGLLQRLGDLLVIFEHVPDPLVGVDDVVEVDLEVEVGGEVALLHPLQFSQDRALRPDDFAEVDDLLLDVGDVADDLLGPLFEDLVLERVELVADLAQHREAVIEAVVDEPVEQIAGAAGEELFAQLLFGPAALEQVLDRLQRQVRDRDHVVGPDEDVELAGAEAARLGVEDRQVEDDEEVVVVDVDLRPLVAREDVLEVKRVELEVLLEPAALERSRPLDVDPAQAVRVDLLDVWLLWLRRRRLRDELATPATGPP